MKSLLPILFIFFVGCTPSRHKWTLQVADHCSSPDAFYIETTYDPVRYKIKVIGNLSDSAKLLVKSKYDQNAPQASGHVYNLESGDVDLASGGDVYQRIMTIIYIPGKVEKTKGHLTIEVEIY